MRKQIRINAVMLAVYAPLLWIGIRELGAQGAAAAWALENFICVAVGAPILLRVFPRIELWRWARHDVLEPLLVVAVIVWAIRLIVSQFSLATTPLGTLAAVGLAGVFALGGACAATAVGRELFRGAGRGWISPYVER
jgi:hypothetical protein